MTSIIFTRLMENDWSEVERLIRSGLYNVNATDNGVFLNDGATILHHACSNNQRPVVNLLISNGAKINARNNDGMTSLHLACLYGHMRVVRLLLSKNANVNARDNGGDTPLFKACQHGNLEIVELLVSFGAHLCVTNNDIKSPRQVADENDKTAVGDYLREQTIPNPHDVLCGENYESDHHPGNLRLKEKIKQKLRNFNLMVPFSPNVFVDSLFHEIRSEEGRFLERVEGTGRLNEVSFRQSLEKIVRDAKQVLEKLEDRAATTAAIVSSLSDETRTEEGRFVERERYDTIPNGTVVSLNGLISKPERNGDRGEVAGFDRQTGQYTVVMEDTEEAIRVKPSNLLQHVHVRLHGIELYPELNGRKGTVVAWNESKERYNIYIMDLSKVVSLKPGNVILDNGTVGRILGVVKKPELNGKSGTIQSFDRESGRYNVQLSSDQVLRLKLENLVVSPGRIPSEDVCRPGAQSAQDPLDRYIERLKQKAAPSSLIGNKRRLDVEKEHQTSHVAGKPCYGAPPPIKISIEIPPLPSFLSSSSQQSHLRDRLRDHFKDDTVEQLKNKLRKKGLPVSGNKADLIERLLQGS